MASWREAFNTYRQPRLLAILVKPRPMVQVGKYLVPEPRRPASATA